jgi:hypothetical protein
VLFAGPDNEGRCAFLEDLVPDGRTVVVRLVRGEPVEGRLELPESILPEDVSVVALRGGHVLAEGEVDEEEGTFRFPALPAGRWRIEAHARRGLWSAAADADAGARGVLLR